MMLVDIPPLLSPLLPLLLQWLQFFADMLRCVQSGSHWAVDLYLRILIAIDSEVVDRHTIHSQEVCACLYKDGGDENLCCLL